MKPFSYALFFLSLLFSFGANAQSEATAEEANNSRRGKIWLDGSSMTADENLFGGFGYFLTENLLIGSRVESIFPFTEDYQLIFSPFVRFYAGKLGKAWLPYAQVEANWGSTNFLSPLNSFGARIGLERNIQGNTLLNIDLDYTNDQDFNGNQWGANVGLNTILGGAAGKNVAVNYFQKGSLLLGNQLFNVSSFSSGSINGFGASLTPSGYYFLSDRLLARGLLRLSTSDFTINFTSSDVEIKEQSLDVSTGLRYYLSKQSLFNLFAEAALAFRYTNAEGGTINNRENESQVFAIGELGNSLFINSTTSFDWGLNGSQNLGNGQGGLELGLFGRLNFWFR